MRQVTVQFLKNPDITHWGFVGYWLGEDEWGDWIAVPAGSNRWKGGDSVRPTPENAVFCAPRGEWWHLHFNGPVSRNYTHFVDIVTPPVWVSDHRYEMIDLDLDVAVHLDGTIEIQDADEFAVHQLQYAYTPEMVERAETETARVVASIESGEEPFFETATAWLGRVG